MAKRSHSTREETTHLFVIQTTSVTEGGQLVEQQRTYNPLDARTPSLANTFSDLRPYPARASFFEWVFFVFFLTLWITLRGKLQ